MLSYIILGFPPNFFSAKTYLSPKFKMAKTCLSPKFGRYDKKYYLHKEKKKKHYGITT